MGGIETKRLGIYKIRACGGKIDSYIWYFLEELKKSTDYLVVICEDQTIGDSDILKLEQIANQYMMKEVHTWISWENIAFLCDNSRMVYNELWYADTEIFGPFYNLDQLCQYIDQDNSIYGYFDSNTNCFSLSFLILKQEVLNQVKWSEILASIKNGVLALEETYRRGIKIKSLCSMALQEQPFYLVKHEKVPFLPVSRCLRDYGDILDQSAGESLPKTLKYLQKSKLYPVGLMWKHLLRVGNMADLKKNLHCNYVLSSKVSKPFHLCKIKIALILHIYYEDLASFCRRYAENMPEGTDVYITVPNEEKLQKVKEAFIDFPYHIDYRIVGNVGRDVGPFIVGCKDIIFKYDLICKMHDKKVFQVLPMSVGESWAYKCFENMLKNEIYVKNIIATFMENPELGMLTPPIPIHGPYYPTMGFGEWSTNYNIVKELAQLLKLEVSIEADKEPVAPLGSMFWFRPQALKCLFAHDWSYDELPKEPIADDATILHGIERIYPFCMQQEGYYCGWVMVDSFARIEINNWRYINHELQSAEAEKVGYTSHKELLERIARL